MIQSDWINVQIVTTSTARSILG